MLARAIAVGTLVGTTVAAAQVRHPVPLPDPARDLVRVELRLTTNGGSAAVRVLGALVAYGNGRRESGPARARASVDQDTLTLSGNADGQSATAVFRVVLAQVTPEVAVGWQLDVPPARQATLEIYNANDPASTRLVDRFDATGQPSFTTGGASLRSGGPLAPPHPPAERLVLGFYFPWYERSTWADPQLQDQPLRTYSTEDPADLSRELQDAKRAGLDGVIVSFQGKDIGGGWNHRRMLLVLQAAQQAGLRVSVQIETLAAHLPDRPGPPHPDTLTAWLTDIVDLYATHPAYLRVEGRPAVFIYVWFAVDEAVWREALGRVRTSGRQLYVLADTTNPATLGLADSLYTFGGNAFVSDIARYTNQRTLMTRTSHLVDGGATPQRLGIATVSPGYDDRALRDRSSFILVDRQGGAFYDAQWRAAVDSGADWVLVSTWNEWWENTQIEPSQRYGEHYLGRTRLWASAFKVSPRN